MRLIRVVALLAASVPFIGAAQNQPEVTLNQPGAPQAAPEAAAEPAAPERPEGVKGELSSLGATKLSTQNTRFGVRAGLSRIGQVFYLAGSAELDLRFDKFMTGLAVPVQVPLYDPSLGTAGLIPQGFTLRPLDYSIPSNLVRLVRYLSYGKKEDNLYVSVGTETSATIGHGSAVRRYVANVDVNQAKLSAEIDAYGKYGGGELFIGDVLSPQSMVAAIGFIKPFGGSDALALQRLSIGFTYAADLAAPYLLERGAGNRQVLSPAEPAATVSAEERAKWNPLPAVKESRTAQIVGVSIETKVVKTESADVKPYLELSQLIGGGGGASLGALGRFTLGTNIKHAFRLVGELRGFQGNYLPGYFDTFYGVQKYQYFTGRGDPTKDKTKLEEILTRDSALKLGYYAELQYAMIDWFALTLAWEDSNAVGGRNLVLHAEVPASETLRFFVSAHRRAVEGDLFEFGQDAVSRQLLADNTLLIAGARLRILPILYLNLRAYRMWQIDTLSQSYRNVDGFQADFEVGYEFSRKED